ncbi:uncharacterized protein [Phaseolus vulgaris]|uniref:uncharacterized protein n=1 Tax=Phaseolus vulgaris TaxID=3885 RepID=UPI0035CC6F5A
MSEFKMPFVEGVSINRPPMFGGVVKEETVKKPWSEWSETERKKAQYDSLAKNIITSALNMDEFFRVSQCNSAKEMWEVLEVTHEGTYDVKRSRKHSLIQEYELFRTQSEESIADVQKRFTHIVNHLTGLGKVFDKEELNIKVLKCFDRSWQPKVTAISESRDLSKMSTIALFGKLMEHELELKRLKEQETVEKRAKGIALKTTMEHYTSEEKKNSEHDETLSLLTRKFSHIKVDCPNNQNKEKSTSKKSEKGKGKKAYISWEENDVSSTSDSSTGSEEANMCFMVNDEGLASDSVSDYSTDSENYDQLLIAFKETHDEANRLVVICNKLNKVNRVLEPKVKALEEELHKSKTDLKNNRKNQWYLDSGCSKHMTGDMAQFTSLKLKAEGHVTYGDNNRGRILGRGNVGTADSTTIENVLYVEGLKHSLLSISQLCDKGYKVNFETNNCTISSETSDLTMKVSNDYFGLKLRPLFFGR